jgi:hypothetical protein
MVMGEQHAAIGRHRGLAAGSVVGQHGHHVAPDGAQLVAVMDPAIAPPTSTERDRGLGKDARRIDALFR